MKKWFYHFFMVPLGFLWSLFFSKIEIDVLVFIIFSVFVVMRIGFLVGVFHVGVFLFVSGEGLFRFGVCFIIALFFYSFLIISLSVFFSLTAGLSTVSSLSSVLLHWQELPGRLQSMRLGARFLERSYLQGPGHRCCCRPEWSLGLL